MNKKLPAAVLTLLLYAQFGFGVAAVAALVYNRSGERHPVVSAEASQTRMADAGVNVSVLR